MFCTRFSARFVSSLIIKLQLGIGWLRRRPSRVKPAALEFLSHRRNTPLRPYSAAHRRAALEISPVRRAADGRRRRCFASLALQLDILVLTWMTNLTTVGLFSGPYRISMALRVIPQTLSLPLYPLYSRTAHLSRAALHRGLPVEHKVFRSYQLSHCRFFSGMVEADPAAGAGTEVSARNSRHAASRHRYGSVLPFRLCFNIFSPRSTSRSVFSPAPVSARLCGFSFWSLSFRCSGLLVRRLRFFALKQ